MKKLLALVVMCVSLSACNDEQRYNVFTECERQDRHTHIVLNKNGVFYAHCGEAK